MGFAYCVISGQSQIPCPCSYKRSLECLFIFQVYYLGKGEESKQWLQQPGNTLEKLCLSHIKAVASCVASSYPTVTPVVWDDMLREISEETLAGETRDGASHGL